MYKRDGMSTTECLTHSARIQRLEPDNGEGRWAAVLTAECGFFSAACLQRLFLARLFGLGIGRGRSARRSSGDDWSAAREKALQLVMVPRNATLGVHMKGGF
jgi:hypothetical protein